MMTYKSLFFATGILLTVSCGSTHKQSTPQQADSPLQTPESRELIQIPVDVAEEDNGFALTAATSFSITVDSCASGHTAVASESSSILSVYKFDQGCLAKLTAFTSNGVSYEPSGGDPFESYAVGDTATFVEVGNPANSIQVEVIETLQSPIQGSESVIYSVSQIASGSDHNVAASEISQSHTFSVEGAPAPDFTVTSVSFEGMSTQGAGEFLFTLTCNVGQVGSDTSSTCGDISLASIEYKLIEDTFSSSMSMAEAQGVFATAGTTISNAEVIADSGFETAILRGPDQIALHSSMILILKSGPTSFQYFNVDLAALNL